MSVIAPIMEVASRPNLHYSVLQVGARGCFKQATQLLGPEASDDTARNTEVYNFTVAGASKFSIAVVFPCLGFPLHMPARQNRCARLQSSVLGRYLRDARNLSKV
jgi:hypothetical protein